MLYSCTHMATVGFKGLKMLLFAFAGGGSGFVGRYLQKCLRKKGYHVKIISRNPLKDALTWVRLTIGW